MKKIDIFTKTTLLIFTGISFLTFGPIYIYANYETCDPPCSACQTCNKTTLKCQDRVCNPPCGNCKKCECGRCVNVVCPSGQCLQCNKDTGLCESKCAKNCKECINGSCRYPEDRDKCLQHKCVDGVWQPKDCPTCKHCENGGCKKNCTGCNECIDNECVPKPSKSCKDCNESTGEWDKRCADCEKCKNNNCVTDCGNDKCKECTQDGCKPKNCPNCGSCNKTTGLCDGGCTAIGGTCRDSNCVQNGSDANNPDANSICQARRGDPVALNTGEFRFSARDLYVPGRVLSIEIVRTYRS